MTATDTAAPAAEDPISVEPARALRSVLLEASRRIAPGEVHYIDHPLFGAVLKVEPWDPDAAANPAPAPAPAPGAQPAGRAGGAGLSPEASSAARHSSVASTCAMQAAASRRIAAQRDRLRRQAGRAVHHHRQHAVTQPELARERRLGQRRHADQVAAVARQTRDLCRRFQPRPLRASVDRPRMQQHPRRAAASPSNARMAASKGSANST